MTNIFERAIEAPSAWIGEQLGGKEAVTYRLGQEELEAIDSLLERTRDRGLHEVRAPEFNHPVLDRTLETLLQLIMNGRGLVIVSGLTPERYTGEQMERVYWGFGTHWGRAAVQSVYGDLMGYVQVNEQDPYARAYRSADELAFHCDTYELVGLMCVQKAEEGGMSRMVSSLTIHNEMLRRHPDLLAPLYEGYYLAPPELQHSERPVTDVKTPVFCHRAGLVSCTYAANFMKRAAERRGETLPQELAAAIRAFDEIVSEPQLQLNAQLEPGDMMFWQNFTNLHARTSFKNSATRRRKLLRLWLTPENPRPVDPRFHSRAQAYAWYYEHEKAKQK
jgi:Taurine catabolism dioxygenase TauD, TfdA family